MRTLVITQNVAPDGAIEMLDDWFAPSEEPDPELLAPTRRQGRQPDARLLVRRAFEDCRGHWPRQRHDTTVTPFRRPGCSTRARSGPGSPTPRTSPPAAGHRRTCHEPPGTAPSRRSGHLAA